MQAGLTLLKALPAINTEPKLPPTKSIFFFSAKSLNSFVRWLEDFAVLIFDTTEMILHAREMILHTGEIIFYHGFFKPVMQ